MTNAVRLARLKTLLANFTRGSLFVADVDDDALTLKATIGGEWSADLAATLGALASLRRPPGWAEPEDGCRELVRFLAAHVPLVGPEV